MLTIKTKGADTTPLGSRKSPLESAAGTFEGTPMLSAFLTSKELAGLAQASTTTRQMTADVRKKHALKSLLSAVVCGNEDLARKIVTSRPDLLLDSSAIVTDLSGKEITGLTALKAAICAGDVDMVRMIKDVLQQKLQSGVTLNFTPELEIQRQLTTIYPNGIDAKEEEQKADADAFKNANELHNYNLMFIFAAINAATDAEVQYELETPGQHKTDSQLNTALHNFEMTPMSRPRSKNI
jgi:hypothetical protein